MNRFNQIDYIYISHVFIYSVGSIFHSMQITVSSHLLHVSASTFHYNEPLIFNKVNF